MHYDVDEGLLRRIHNYTVLGRNETEAMLGRTAMFRAIFEAQLQEEGLPEILSFLPVIESGMNAGIYSPAGAAGLWQLMPQTARIHGLTVNPLLDERLDVYKSTAAAVKMLSGLYEQFGDWGLVLIAYNSGPAKVTSAVRAAGTRDYARLSRYLPAETRVYVPAFVAAAYVCRYYTNHQLIPRYPVFSREGFRSVRIHEQLSFAEVARVTKLPLASIARLNPSFKQHHIPRSETGHLLILPASSTARLRETLGTKEEENGKYFQTTYVVSGRETLRSVADLFKVKVEDLVRWNGLRNAKVVVNQELQLFLSRKALLDKV